MVRTCHYKTNTQDVTGHNKTWAEHVIARQIHKDITGHNKTWAQHVIKRQIRKT